MTATTQPPASTVEAALLSRKDEYLQSVKIGENTIILSAWDQISFGTPEGLSTDWRTGNSGQVYLFAEDLAFADTFQANGGVISAHSLAGVKGGPATLDLSGAAGDTPQAQPGGTPQPGGTGLPGGTLSVYLEEVDPAIPAPFIHAPGGQGGGGQPGDNTKGGGNGGDGGKGGTVTAVISHPGLRWLESLKAVYALTDPVTKRAALNQFAQRLPLQPAALAGLRWHLLSVTEGSPTNATVNEAIVDAGRSIDVLVSDWRAKFLATLDVSGGAPGPYGAGTPDGSPGKQGDPGTATVGLIGSVDQPDQKAPAFFRVHAGQCAMTLEKAKTALLFTDPLKNPKGIAYAAQLLERVRARTAPFVDLDEKSELARLYASSEAQFGCVNSVAMLRSINAEASMYLSYLQRGLDFFGYRSDYVPLTSVQAIAKDGIKPIRDAFDKIQSDYDAQYAQLQEQKKTLDYVRGARSQVLALQAQVNVNLPQLRSSLTASATIIDGYQAVLPAKRKAFDAALKQYETAIKDCFEFDLKVLVGAIEQIAKDPKSPLAYLQAAGDVYSGMTEIDDAGGEPVNKKLLVKRVQAVEAKVDKILEGVRTLNDGTIELDDPGANKLVTAAEDLEVLLEQLYGKFPIEAEALKQAMADYVDAVTARNTQVLDYNAAVTMIVQYTQMQEQIKQRAQSLNDQALGALSADLPGLMAFVSQAYYGARAKVLEFMDLAARAYRFWALEDGDLLKDSIGGIAPPEINSALLDSIQANFWDKYTRAIGKLGSGQVFPATGDERGELFTVTGPAIETLKQTYQLLVQIPLATKETSEGLFLNMANVRVTHARAFIKGAKTSTDVLNLTVTHTGAEQIVNPNNQVFRFQHQSIPKTFKYRISTDKILEDATFQIGAAGSAKDLAMVGPYTIWHVTVDPRYNPGLDLSGVTAVEFEFHGLSWGYN